MRRKTFQRLRQAAQPEHHHHVYVVLLKPAAARMRKVRAANPARDGNKECVYVGMTGLTPEERFANHKAGIKAASAVKRYGVRLMPEQNPFTQLDQKHMPRNRLRFGSCVTSLALKFFFVCFVCFCAVFLVRGSTEDPQ